MNNEIYITVSMGISIFTDNSTDVDILLRLCDFTMYKSKRKGKNAYTIFETKLADIYYREAEIKNELEIAIEREELHAFFNLKLIQ